MEWEAAVIRWEWDADLRVVRGYGADDVLLGTRDYTADENAAADAYVQFETRRANREAITAQAVGAIADLGSLIADIDKLWAVSDATINANPTQYIKSSALRVKKVAQIERSLLRFVFGHFDQIN